MSTQDALLAAVLANPADDTVRGAYADWLEENGQPERAEFIRVQVEIIRWIKENTASVKPDPHIYGVRGYISREKELWKAKAYGDKPDGLIAALSTDYFGHLDSHRLAIFRRGFVSEVRCTLADWCGACERCGGAPGTCSEDCHVSGAGTTPGIGPEVVRRHPVERVVLTDRDPWGDGRQTFSWWIEDARADESERQRRSNLPESVYSWLNCFDNPSSTAGMSKRYPTREAADAALFAALIAWAKSQPHPARIVTTPVSVDFILPTG